MDRGDDKIAPLMAALEKSDKPTLRKAVDALIPIAADDRQIATTLSELLNDPGRENRWPIAYMASLPHCLSQRRSETLDHQDPDIRWAVDSHSPGKNGQTSLRITHRPRSKERQIRGEWQFTRCAMWG
jgi:hypothetical protein